MLMVPAGFTDYEALLGGADAESDGYEIRRCAVENGITMFTALDTVKVLLDVLEEITMRVSTIDDDED